MCRRLLMPHLTRAICYRDPRRPCVDCRLLRRRRCGPFAPFETGAINEEVKTTPSTKEEKGRKKKDRKNGWAAGLYKGKKNNTLGLVEEMSGSAAAAATRARQLKKTRQSAGIYVSASINGFTRTEL